MLSGSGAHDNLRPRSGVEERRAFARDADWVVILISTRYPTHYVVSELVLEAMISPLSCKNAHEDGEEATQGESRSRADLE